VSRFSLFSTKSLVTIFGRFFYFCQTLAMKKTTFPLLPTNCFLPALAFLFLMVSTRIAAQTELWGMTTSKGAAGNGSIIKLNTDGSNFSSYSFGNQGGSSGDLLESGGKFYGVTTSGGNSDSGVLFEYDHAAGTYTVKHHFGYTNGCCPYGSLIASSGKFYGMTQAGGSSNRGTLFEYDPAGGGAGSYTVKYHFDDTSGGRPLGSLVESGGRFYGMTYTGGINNKGVLFEYDPATGGNGTYTVKHHFDLAYGGNPQGSLIASGGKFYGMTRLGGNGEKGVLFEYDPATGGSGTYTVKHYFAYPDGANPTGSLIASGGKFYGMTPAGGNNYYGNIFEYDPAGSGTFTVMHYFGYGNGCYPNGSLIAWDGKLYGMTLSGGSSNLGVIFEYDPAGGGVYTILRHLTEADGANPIGSLITVTLTNTVTPAKDQAFKMLVSPNPSDEQVSIEIFSENALSGNLAIYNLSGSQIAVLSQDRIFQGQERIIWQPADLPAGMYFLLLQTDAGVYTAKIVRK